jgi:DNA invertase Pin-like site-specific DNA recombinase
MDKRIAGLLGAVAAVAALNAAQAQILGAVAQFDKAMTVAKLRGALKRKRRKTGGRKTFAERHPEAIAMARELAKQTRRLP